MTLFYIYNKNNQFNFSAQNIFKIGSKIFLIESNKDINKEDIIQLSENCYDIKDNSFYVMAIIDEITKEIILSYGFFSYCHSLYYYIEGEEIYINLSLHDLLNNTKIIPTLDIKSANEFVKYGFVREEKSLIENINKVPALKTYIFKGNKIETIDSKYIKNKSIGNYADNLKHSFPFKDTKIILPLSGGFDSTLLAYLLKDYDNTIAVTLGSLKDTDSEFSNANHTAEYLSMKQERIYSTDDWIESLPKIVDIMEGEMFDIGLFLCYFLVERVKELGLTDYTFITGDGADQLLNKNFYIEKFSIAPSMRRLENPFLNMFPKHFFYYLIIKKLEWMLRQEDINYIMPFISDEFYNCAKQYNHSTTKEEYKSFVKSFVPKEISQPLRKRGGQVRAKFFTNDYVQKKFLQILNQPKYKNIFDEKNIIDSDLRNIIYRMYIVFFNYIFIKNQSIDKDFEALLNNLL